MNSGKEGRHIAGWEAWKHTAVHQPRWLLHAWRGASRSTAAAELKTQTAQRGWGTDGWKPTTAKAADTFTARDIGRIGKEHQGQGIGPSKNTKHIKPRCSQGCMHTCRETEVGISSLQPHSQHHTSQPRWWVVAQPQRFKTGRVLKRAWRIRWQ